MLDRLQAVAAQLAARVRDEDPQANARWLMATLPDPADRFALHFVQAAATPVDQPWSQLVAWVEQPPPQGGRVIVIDERLGGRVAACGTLGGSRRHRHRREPTCADCLAAERDYNQQRRKARAEAKSA